MQWWWRLQGFECDCKDLCLCKFSEMHIEMLLSLQSHFHLLVLVRPWFCIPTMYTTERDPATLSCLYQRGTTGKQPVVEANLTLLIASKQKYSSTPAPQSMQATKVSLQLTDSSSTNQGASKFVPFSPLKIEAVWDALSPLLHTLRRLRCTHACERSCPSPTSRNRWTGRALGSRCASPGR